MLRSSSDDPISSYLCLLTEKDSWQLNLRPQKSTKCPKSDLKPSKMLSVQIKVDTNYRFDNNALLVVKSPRPKDPWLGTRPLRKSKKSDAEEKENRNQPGQCLE